MRSKVLLEKRSSLAWPPAEFLLVWSLALDLERAGTEWIVSSRWPKQTSNVMDSVAVILRMQGSFVELGIMDEGSSRVVLIPFVIFERHSFYTCSVFKSQIDLLETTPFQRLTTISSRRQTWQSLHFQVAKFIIFNNLMSLHNQRDFLRFCLIIFDCFTSYNKQAELCLYFCARLSTDWVVVVLSFIQ